MRSNFPVLLVACAFDVISKKSLPNLRSQRIMSMFSSTSVIVLVIAFRSLINFELISICVVRKNSNIHLLFEDF